MSKINGFQRGWAAIKGRDVGERAERSFLLSFGFILTAAAIFFLSVMGCGVSLPDCESSVDDDAHLRMFETFNPVLDVTIETDLLSEDQAWVAADKWNDRTGTSIAIAMEPREGALSVTVIDGGCEMEAVAQAEQPSESECVVLLNPCRFPDEFSKSVTFAHELGHCLTFGHNANPKSLMCGAPFDCSWDQCVPTITDNMVNAVQKALLN